MKAAELNIIANQMYIEMFKIPFSGWVEWSNRLRRNVGNCRSDGRITINLKYYELYGVQEALEVLKHELCHLYLFNTIGRHNDYSPEFKELIKKVDAKAKGKPMPIKVYIYECPCCNKQWHFKRKINKNLACNECSNGYYDNRYKIEFIEQRIISPLMKEK